ncbi:MAG: glycosyltransferase family 2 protein [Planctomycetaceae bacterium]|nr:glycosyltransferase family 2 protein [Planctomycetaceae bacterium]
MIRYSIAICTYNRAELLHQTLDSLASVDGVTASDVEVVVVNNNSTDRTPAILEEYAARLPLTVINEPQQGHCFARNRAATTAQGEIILWTDDDVLFDAQWLKQYRNEIERLTNHSFWGGPIEPQFLTPPPRWIRENWQTLSGCFAARDLGPTPVEMDSNRLPYGANFAVRRELCRQFPFDTRLGRSGSGVVGEDERDFLLRLVQSGHLGRWVPTAKVQHLIPAHRATLEYISKYFAGQARVQTWRGRQPIMSKRELAQAVRHHWLGWQWTRWTGPSSIWLQHWIKLAMFQEWQATTLD